jgi:hypothetical protein
MEAPFLPPVSASRPRADSSMAGIPRPVGSCGADTPSRRRVSLGPRPGRRTVMPGREGVGQPGARVPMTPSSTSSTGEPGNAEPYDPRPREGMDSLFTSSVLAIRPKTGEIVCYYQYTPNDVYDVDGAEEHVLADMQVGGQARKVSSIELAAAVLQRSGTPCARPATRPHRPMALRRRTVAQARCANGTH